MQHFSPCEECAFTHTRMHIHKLVVCQGHQCCGSLRDNSVEAMWKWVDAVSLLLLTFLSSLLLFFSAFFSVCPSLAHCAWLSFSPHTSRLIKTQSKWVWQGCHVCSSRGRRGPVQRQEVSYPYISLFLPPAGLSISLLFCHTLSPSHSFPSSVSLPYSCVTFPLSHSFPLQISRGPLSHSETTSSQLNLKTLFMCKTRSFSYRRIVEKLNKSALPPALEISKWCTSQK